MIGFCSSDDLSLGGSGGCVVGNPRRRGCRMAVHFLQLGQGRSRGDARRRSTTAANSKIAVGLPWPTVSRLTPHAVLRPEASLLLRFQRLSVASVRRVFSTRSLLGFYRVLPCFFLYLTRFCYLLLGFRGLRCDSSRFSDDSSGLSLFFRR